MFIAKGVMRCCEKDDYKEGEIPGSGYNIIWDIDFSAKTKKELIEKIKEFHDIEDDAIINKGNKIYIQMMEKPLYDRWITPSNSDVENWKEGNVELYVVDYSYRIFEEVKSEVN